MAKDQGSKTQGRPQRRGPTPPARPPATATAAPAAAAVAKPRFNLVQFSREVRAEARKISWTTRKETWITSVMVLIMVVITAIFFLVVDWALGAGMAQILKFATGG